MVIHLSRMSSRMVHNMKKNHNIFINVSYQLTIGRLFPELLAKKNHNFSLNQCSYVLKPCKKQTARWVMFKNCGVPFTYTIESTFGVMRDKAVVSDDFIQIGEDIATSAYEFLYITNIK